MQKKHKVTTVIGLVAACTLLMGNTSGCDSKPDSDSVQTNDQENILLEGARQVGMPAITNFSEKKMYKYIYEMRDRTNLSTFTYIQNEVPKVVKGVTSRGGSLTYLGPSLGYPIPYSTEFTSPSKIVWKDSLQSVVPQADPNGLFAPASADGTWISMVNPKTGKAEPQYIEPRIMVFTYKLPED